MKQYYSKYYRGLFGEAQKRGQLSLLMNFYRLKTINTEGVIQRKGSIQLLSKLLSLSQSQIYQVLNKLKTIGWIRIMKSEIQLSSMDKIVQSFDINPAEVKRWKISREKTDYFLQEFGLVEVSYSLFIQNKKIDKELKKIEKSDTEKMPRQLILLNKQSEQKVLIRYHLSNKFKQNWFSSLSTHKVADLLGYSSAMSAWNFLKTLDSMSMIDYRPQKPLFIAKVFNKTEFKSLNLDDSFFLSKNNIIFKKLTNEITVL